MEDSFQLSVFSKGKTKKGSLELPAVLAAAGCRLEQQDVSSSSREPSALMSPEPSVVLLGFHSQPNNGVQNNCYERKMCLITGSSRWTMETFQSIFLGHKKNQSKSYAFSSYALSSEKGGKRDQHFFWLDGAVRDMVWWKVSLGSAGARAADAHSSSRSGFGSPWCSLGKVKCLCVT